MSVDKARPIADNLKTYDGINKAISDLDRITDIEMVVISKTVTDAQIVLPQELAQDVRAALLKYYNKEKKRLEKDFNDKIK